jgi:hypothetical protein
LTSRSHPHITHYTSHITHHRQFIFPASPAYLQSIQCKFLFYCSPNQLTGPQEAAVSRRHPHHSLSHAAHHGSHPTFCSHRLKNSGFVGLSALFAPRCPWVWRPQLPKILPDVTARPSCHVLRGSHHNSKSYTPFFQRHFHVVPTDPTDPYPPCRPMPPPFFELRWPSESSPPPAGSIRGRITPRGRPARQILRLKFASLAFVDQITASAQVHSTADSALRSGFNDRLHGSLV